MTGRDRAAGATYRARMTRSDQLDGPVPSCSSASPPDDRGRRLGDRSRAATGSGARRRASALAFVVFGGGLLIGTSLTSCPGLAPSTRPTSPRSSALCGFIARPADRRGPARDGRPPTGRAGSSSPGAAAPWTLLGVSYLVEIVLERRVDAPLLAVTMLLAGLGPLLIGVALAGGRRSGARARCRGADRPARLAPAGRHGPGASWRTRRTGPSASARRPRARHDQPPLWWFAVCRPNRSSSSWSHWAPRSRSATETRAPLDPAGGADRRSRPSTGLAAPSSRGSRRPRAPASPSLEEGASRVARAPPGVGTPPGCGASRC